jgi:hypothetical protein
MAFPGTYNFNYYRGDTLEFDVYPKDSDGNQFNLTGYTARFVVADTAGDDQAVKISTVPVTYPSQGNYIRCVITPSNGESLSGGTTYVYDLEITKPAAAGVEDSYPYIYTILTGNIIVTEQVAMGSEG